MPTLSPARTPLPRAAAPATETTTGRPARSRRSCTTLSAARRCRACHPLADRGANRTGPNLWGVFDRQVGTLDAYENFSDALKAADFVWTPDTLNAWLADPRGFLEGNEMAIPEAVPENERAPIISFLMIETGAVDWPVPENAFADAQADKSKPPAERFPSFWNHLMTNTSRYRWERGEEELKFDAYFNTDGSIDTSIDGMNGFWHITDKDFFCYALKGMPVDPGNMVECFPIAAMAIPRFAEELWTSRPYDDVSLHGGIVPGRPQQGG